MTTKRSPLAPDTYPEMPVIAGVRMGSAQAGIKYRGRTDVMVMLFEPGTTVAGVFTRSRCPSAPVDFCRANLAGGTARMLVVNSGNANAFTGRRGKAAVEETARAAAGLAGCGPEQVFLASTGVIGEPLDASRITAVLGDCVAGARPDRWLEAAQAIMTTDTYPKLASAECEVDGVRCRVSGIAKGAGMIAPDMATMLSFVVTDAPISAQLLQAELARAVEPSFNSITVDSDTSTSDTLLVFATGKAGLARPLTDPADARILPWRAALERVLGDLARQVVCDGEGATKEIEITVQGAVSPQSARRIAFSIANSPLVKTAIAGEDANWGRVVMAVGKAGEPADRDRLAIWFGDIRVAHAGERDPDYSEEAVSAYMRNSRIAIRVDIGLGDASATVWTCDLTKEYVAINGDYRS
jgi:glutamate N-acetyltransferase/amino-acid N-acetyltransferase